MKQIKMDSQSITVLEETPESITDAVQKLDKFLEQTSTIQSSTREHLTKLSEALRMNPSFEQQEAPEQHIFSQFFET
ncbi:uncharacterized protein MONOS_3425 [Monocercomonoides exilis]|uniref:uncharacterized protein n=1 Tax=Monocercomonoides exilis TaxID=2049356 RepID=UPI00355AC89A|nr:hypothetical protein MONOS_3425 [Monocercomonoides exilis]|eukprot:MONOS_3425.1-p1 / transcript=MONOS_3425.1 / gene=MONOS_3425 / organism=Monocercomonoides_exilis_PA203 / gene_product=unspecified product / transcript_product=unspecified product / location=Mono_scaffold00080:122347-122809(-) / protein_length=77 / sequence_SO=supercontig / SO=protein_coding / is_pseudo=false